MKVEKNQAGLEACLRGPNDTKLHCAVAVPRGEKEREKEGPEAPEDWAARLVEQFHKDAFAMRVGMTTRDLDSLDGSVTVASQAQREQLQGVLQDVAKDSTNE